MTYRSKTAALAGALLLLAGPASAANPSADDMIRMLRPTGPSATTRGIHRVGPSADPAAAAPASIPDQATRPAPRAATRPAPNEAAVARPGASPAAAPSLDLTVQFASGSAELTPAASHTLDDLGRALSSSALAGYRFRIEGHTDTVGTPAANKALSDARAAKVVEYLTGKWGVDRARVASVGMGQEQLLVPTGPNVAQPRNRRVTVINLGT